LVSSGGDFIAFDPLAMGGQNSVPIGDDLAKPIGIGFMFHFGLHRILV
jgi:hypothetical protein